MKTFKLFAILLAAVMSLSLVACGNDSDEPINKPTEPETPTEDKAMSQLEQKQYLEKVALEFMDLTPSSDFNDISNVINCFKDNYLDDYNWDAVDEWVEDVLDNARKALGTQTTETETYYYSVYNYIYNNYSAVLMASNFTGHFTATNGRWVRENADDLQVIFNDEYGKKCVIKLETKGNVKKVYAFNIDEWVNYDGSYSGGHYVSNEYYDRTQYTIGVPEQVIVTLTQGGTQLLKTTVNVDLSSLEGENFDISKSGFTVSSVTEMNNGYKITASDVAYSGNKSASSTVVVSKGNKTLATVACAGDVNDLPSVNVSAFSSENSDIDDYDTENTDAKNVFVKMDILGKVQIQGKVSDCRKFADYLDAAEDNESNQSMYTSYINQAKSLTDINLFYNGSNLKQATVKLEPFAEESWSGRTYWTYEPVLYFYDGSSYSTFEAFFNDVDFKQTINKFKNIANKYAALINEQINW